MKTSEFKQAKKLKRRDALYSQHAFNSRATISILFIILCFLTLISRSFFLQVIEHNKYTTLSNSNRIKLVPLSPTRGQIFDRNGELLATNTPSFNLTITRQDITLSVDEIISQISTIITLEEYDISRYKRLESATPRQNPTLLKERLTNEEIALLSVNLYRFNGVEITPQLTRVYPNKHEAVHAIGYVGRIDERDLKEIDAENNTKEYLTLTHIGKKGAEKSFEHILRGSMGFEKVETNSNGRIIRSIDRMLPVSGQDIFLTLDLRLQRVTEEILGNNTGAIVALDPQTGDILAFASTPGYDPNLFVNGITTKDYQELNDNPEKPFLNRIMQGQYPPGSTIKPQIALAGLEHKIVSPTTNVYCGGYFQIPGNKHRFRDWRKWGHGNVDLYKSLVYSCDIYYYELAYKLGIIPMTDFLRQFALGTQTGIDLLGEYSGVSPTPAYKERVFKQPWYAGETVTAGIGQSYWLTTPLQIAQATTIVAMKGQAFKPHLLQATQYPNESHKTMVRPKPITPITLSNPNYWNSVINGMVGVVHDNRGTARKIRGGLSYKIAGKSGTAQVKTIAQNAVYDKASLAKKHHDHAWFTAFAPAENPKIAIAVLIENGGSGSGVAAPIAREVINAWLTDFQSPRKTPLIDARAGE